MSEKRISVFTSDDALVVARKSTISPNAIHFLVEMDPASPIQSSFGISLSVELRLRELEPQTRARLGTLFLDLQAAGNLPPVITEELIEQAQSRQPLLATVRAERLLRFFYDETTQIGQMIQYEWSGEGARGPLLHSESLHRDELRFLLNFLNQQQLIDVDSSTGFFLVTMTVEGLGFVADQTAAPDSRQAFVAMWFDPSMENLFRKGIAPGIEDAGYEPFRVDQEPTLHRIDDQIIAQIRRSRFIVADFTQGDSGARGSVYYEAGFAHGLDIPVIFTCHQNQIKKLHFDTRQHYHIGWTEPADLREPLKHRIEALIGRGPRAESG